jgi:hypothetical protein
MIHKLGFLFYIAFCVEAGFFLSVVPWSRLWEQNLLALQSPVAAAILRNGYVRGAVSGVGVVLLLVGLLEAYSLIRSRKSGKSSS